MIIELSKKEILAMIQKSFPGKVIKNITFNQKRVSDSSITIEVDDAEVEQITEPAKLNYGVGQRTSGTFPIEQRIQEDTDIFGANSNG